MMPTADGRPAKGGIMFGDGNVPFYEATRDRELKRPALVGVGVIGAILIVCAIISCSTAGRTTTLQIDTATESQTSTTTTNEAQNEAAQATIYVQVIGCVKNPGVYQIAEGSRVIDAVNAAGGLSEDASPESLNLAGVLEDGLQIKVLSVTEYEAQTQSSNTSSEAVSVTSGYTSTATNGKININTATLEQLETLSGIGESTAQKIIDYRKANGSFQSIDDLTQVSGIGEKKLEAIKDQITV